MPNETVPSWVADAIFYEIVPDRFAPPSEVDLAGYDRAVFEPWDGPATGRAYRGGTLWGVIERLDWLAELGVTALYLTPIHVSPTFHRYKPADHLHVDPMLGGDAAFDALMREARARGLRIVLDGVFNHVGFGFRGFLDVMEYGPRSPYHEWFHVTEWPVRVVDGAEPATHEGWNGHATMPRLNHDNPAVREYLLSVAEHWARRGIAGWRLDAAAEMDGQRELWRAMRRRTRAIDPDFYLLGETWLDPSAWLDGTQWDGATNFPFAFSCREYVGGARLDTRFRLPGQGSAAHVDAPEMARRVGELQARHPTAHVLAQLNFVNNHDLSRFRTAVGGDSRRAALADLLLFTYPGPPCILYGDEVGLEGGLPPDSFRGYPAASSWDEAVLRRYGRLIALRRRSAALRRGTWTTLHAEGRVLVFARSTPDETAIVALNTGEVPAEVAIPWTSVAHPLGDLEVTALAEFSARGDGAALHLSVPGLSGGVVTAARARPKVEVSSSAPTGRQVVVVGNIGIDTNVYLPAGWEGPAGEGDFTLNLDVIGQAGGYCAFGFARLGLRTGVVGYVGDDPLGRWIDGELGRAGIDRLLFTDPAGTSRSINLMRSDGRRHHFYDGKSHMDLRPDLAACEGFVAGARLAHVHLPNWGRLLLPALRARGCRISCDLQDVTSPDDPYRREFVEAADFVFFSAVNLANPEQTAAALLARRPDLVVVVGMGSRGAGLMTRDSGFRSFPPVDHPDPVIDTNGAGDSLAVGFLTAHVLEGRPLEEAVRRGQIAARHVCTLRGGWRELITRDELDRTAKGP